jgi:PleD family two-component response regulator
MQAAGQQHHIGATAGVILVSSQHDLEELIRQADHALIRGKIRAKNKTYLTQVNHQGAHTTIS